MKSFDQLPMKLKPADIDAGSGLLPRVVRALYYVYPPLTSIKRDFTTAVINRRCLVFWWEKEYSRKKHCFIWNYLFKFVEVDGKRKANKNGLHVNLEERNIVIRAKCPNYIHLQQKSFIGMVLTSFHACMSSDMRYHKLKLVFHLERRDKKYAKEEGQLLNINPVIEYSIIPWWSPNYPYLVQ